MAADSNPPPRDDPDDAARLAAYATELADGIERALGPWVERCVARVADEHGGGDDATLRRAAQEAGRRCAAEVGPRVRALLRQDIDDQRTNPLALVRGAVMYPTAVLQRAGVPAPARDPQAQRIFPDDTYDLSPASFADVDPALHEVGLHWGAAKAHVHLRRRRADGQR